jgi:aryl carrier-like protein
MEIEGMSDDALIDECNHILVGLDSKEMDELLAEYFKDGKLTQEQRKKAENLYLLAYMDLAWED